MNLSLSLTLALSLAVVSLGASAAVQPVEVTGDSLTIACTHPELPSLNAVGRVLDINNAGAAYEARTHLMTRVRQACKRGDASLMARRAKNSGELIFVAMR